MSLRPYNADAPMNLGEASVLIYDETGCRHMVVAARSAVHLLAIASTALDCARYKTGAIQREGVLFSKSIQRAMRAERRRDARFALSYAARALLAFKLGFLA